MTNRSIRSMLSIALALTVAGCAADDEVGDESSDFPIQRPAGMDDATPVIAADSGDGASLEVGATDEHVFVVSEVDQAGSTAILNIDEVVLLTPAELITAVAGPDADLPDLAGTVARWGAGSLADYIVEVEEHDAPAGVRAWSVTYRPHRLTPAR